MRTRATPRSVHSTGTTASAPAGIGAPVMIRRLRPRVTPRGARDPAGISPTTGTARSESARRRWPSADRGSLAVAPRMAGRSRPSRHEVLEPTPELGPHVRPLTGQPDDRLEVVGAVAGVVPPTAEDDPVYRLAAVDLALQRVGDLDLAAPAGRGVAQRVEDARGQHVTPDDR